MLLLNGGTLDAGVTLDKIIFHISSSYSHNYAIYTLVYAA